MFLQNALYIPNNTLTSQEPHFIETQKTGSRDPRAVAGESNLRHLNPEIVAAHQLIQLSDEDNSVSIGNGSSSNSKKRNTKGRNEQEVEQTVISDTTLAKILEIFGKDEVYRPRKQRKYRSLANIYRATAPIYVEEGGFNRKENL